MPARLRTFKISSSKSWPVRRKSSGVRSMSGRNSATATIITRTTQANLFVCKPSVLPETECIIQ